MSDFPIITRACAACGYDLRGLPHCICPECGTAFDPSQQIVEAKVYPKLGIVAAAFSAIVAVAAIWHALDMKQGLLAEADSRCGTGLVAYTTGLMIEVPGLLVLTLLGWVAAWKAHHAVPIARGAALSAIGAWLTCLIVGS